MNTKEKLVLLLRENTDRYLSGEAIAKELGLGVGEVKLVIDLFKNQ